MSCDNNSVKLKNISNFNDEKTIEKAGNESNFWELITDVAKDLDLALQDLSPDLEINGIDENGIVGENAGSDRLRAEESSNTLLLESTAIRTAGNNSQQNAVQRQSDTQSDDNIDIKPISAEVSLDKSPSLLQTDCSALLPTFTAHSEALSSKASYSLQLLSLMDNFQITKESDSVDSKLDTISNCTESQVKNNNKELNRPADNVSTVSADSVSDAKTTNDDHSGASCESIPAVIGLLERLIRCHPIWFLPEIGRAGVVHLLQGKEPGCFIVRQSSKPNTMALSVRLPEGKGPHVEHYLIEDAGNSRLHLEGSDNYFSAIPMLVCHYCNCCDELPVQLTLPKVIDESNRQQLTSLALLGQDFWQSSLSKLSHPSAHKTDEDSSSPNSGTTRTNTCSTFKSETKASAPPIPPKQEVPNLIDPLIDTKKSSTVPISRVVAQPNPKVAPKPRPDPPPVPPRSKFVVINNNQSISAQPLNETNVSQTNDNNIDTDSHQNQSSKSSVPPVVSPSVAPNTEITLIQLNDVKSVRNSSAGLTSNSSHKADNQPKEAKKSPTIAQKQVLCYRSSLHDKESDYEDIWNANTLNKVRLKPHLTSLREGKASNQCNRSTQTESSVSANTKLEHHMSTYYIDPIDAIPNRKSQMKASAMRRSDTDINDGKPPHSSLFGHSMESLIDSIRCESTHIDTCQQTFCTFNPNLIDVQLQVGCSTFAKHKTREVRESSWPLDKSWKWLDDNMPSLCGHSFKRSSFSSCRRSSLVESMKSDVTTVEDLIILQTPELSVPKGSQLFSNEMNGLTRREDVTRENVNERYDNLALYRNNNEVMAKQEVINDTDTEFSEPWDSDWWEGLIKKVFPRNALMQFSPETEENYFLLNKERSVDNCENTSTITSLSDSRITSTFDITEVSSIASMPQNRDSTASDRLTVLESNDCGIGLTICNYIFELSAEGNNTFAKAIDHFIQCTKESAETNPLIVMRNIRQFMNGMKNYLVKHGEGQLTQMVELQRSKLKANEFLNIDAILESALHRLVIKPLKHFLYQLFISEYTRNGSLKVLSHNIKEAQTKTPQELGVRPELLSIDSKTMNEIQKYLSRLQQSYSPLKKLEYLLATISTIYNSVRHKLKRGSPNESNGNSGRKAEYASFGADDFLPVLIYVLIHCGVISIEIEADYMLGLLQASILGGEGGYYLTTLSSAVHVIKHMDQMSIDCNTTKSTESTDQSLISGSTPVQRMNSSSSENSVTSTSGHSPYTQIKLPIIADLKAYMKIMIPDEFTSSIAVKTLPIRPNMTTKEVCKMIAHKFKITNAEDFCLFKVIKGEEIALNDTDLPQVIKAEAMATGLDCLFAYKRFDAKFIWPLNKH